MKGLKIKNTQSMELSMEVLKRMLGVDGHISSIVVQHKNVDWRGDSWGPPETITITIVTETEV